MRTRVKLYIEACIDFAKLDIKLHKFFKDYDGDKSYLQDAEMHIKNAEIAIEYNALPSIFKTGVVGENK